MRSPLSLKLFLFCSLATLAVTLPAQSFEGGVLGGFSVYSGDLSPRETSQYTEDFNAAGGAYLRYRPGQRVAFRVNAIFGRLSAEAETRAPDITGELQSVERNFRSSLAEANLQVEVDLFYIGDRNYNYLAPYVFGGVGYMRFNPEGRDADGEYFELQPLATEAQGSGDPRYDDAPYELNRVVFQYGGGLRYNIGDEFVIGLELGARYTGHDYLDDVSATPVNYLDVTTNTNSRAAFFSNPAVDPDDISSDLDLNYRRGGEFDDYYFVGNITLGVLFGGGRQGGGKGKGCYNF